MDPESPVRYLWRVQLVHYVRQADTYSSSQTGIPYRLFYPVICHVCFVSE